jgi:hypothetical protein
MKSPFVNLPDGIPQLPKKPIRIELQPFQALLLYTLLSDTCDLIEKQPEGRYRDNALAAFEDVCDRLHDKLEFSFAS